MIPIQKHFKLAVCVMLSALFITFSLPAHSKDKILIGSAISLSGPYAPGAAMTQIPNYKMWVEEVNAEGGIFVKEYNKRLPVELIIYDDKSDIGTAVKLVEKLVLQDKVDLLLPPWGTAMHFAIAPVANKYGFPLIGPTISSEKLREVAHTIPYFFGILNMPREQGKALADLLAELGIKKVALIYVADAYGIEWTGKVAPDLGLAGIDVALLRSYPLGATDLSPLLKTIKAADVDALLGMSYPPDTFLITEQAKVIDLNPKVFYLGVGVAFPVYRDKFGVETVEGIMGAGAWNPKLPYPGAKEYFDRHVKRWDKEPDRWGSAFAYASLQILQQAIEQVGSLDREKIRDEIATKTFPTVIGPVSFEGGFNVQSPGEIGQWQNGEFEVVAAKEKRTAEPVFPKPKWK
ncbi:MAG: amino acid ABC transporter substrate-binding protein [Deltaproteobacteria bacterium]|jgi:branched-chain amino acid transport system substrate-binding protein